MTILAFAASSYSGSINRKLVTYVTSYFNEDEVEVLDLNDYEMPIYSMDRELEGGIPRLANVFSNKIRLADLIIISFAEHNGSYSVAFKNIFDWISRIPDQKVWHEKPMFLMATSPGSRGGKSVLETAKVRFPYNGGNILDTFSLPNFNENFNKEKGITNQELSEELLSKIKEIKKDLY